MRSPFEFNGKSINHKRLSEPNMVGAGHDRLPSSSQPLLLCRWVYRSLNINKLQSKSADFHLLVLGLSASLCVCFFVKLTNDQFIYVTFCAATCSKFSVSFFLPNQCAQFFLWLTMEFSALIRLILSFFTFNSITINCYHQPQKHFKGRQLAFVMHLRAKFSMIKYRDDRANWIYLAKNASISATCWSQHHFHWRGISIEILIRSSPSRFSHSDEMHRHRRCF